MCCSTWPLNECCAPVAEHIAYKLGGLGSLGMLFLGSVVHLYDLVCTYTPLPLYILIQELLPKWDSKTVGTLSAPQVLPLIVFQ